MLELTSPLRLVTYHHSNHPCTLSCGVSAWKPLLLGVGSSCLGLKFHPTLAHCLDPKCPIDMPIWHGCLNMMGLKTRQGKHACWSCDRCSCTPDECVYSLQSVSFLPCHQRAVSQEPTSGVHPKHSMGTLPSCRVAAPPQLIMCCVPKRYRF